MNTDPRHSIKHQKNEKGKVTPGSILVILLTTRDIGEKSFIFYFLNFFNVLFYFLNIFIDYAITVVPFPPFTPLHPAHPLPPTFCPYSSCPWVILISSLASTFPILFLPSPCLFSTYHLCYLFSVPFPPLSPSHSPVDNPPCDLHFYGSVPVLVVGLVCFCFCFRCGC